MTLREANPRSELAQSNLRKCKYRCLRDNKWQVVRQNRMVSDDVGQLVFDVALRRAQRENSKEAEHQRLRKERHI